MLTLNSSLQVHCDQYLWDSQYDLVTKLVIYECIFKGFVFTPKLNRCKVSSKVYQSYCKANSINRISSNFIYGTRMNGKAELRLMKRKIQLLVDAGETEFD